MQFDVPQGQENKSHFDSWTAKGLQVPTLHSKKPVWITYSPVLCSWGSSLHLFDSVDLTNHKLYSMVVLTVKKSHRSGPSSNMLCLRVKVSIHCTFHSPTPVVFKLVKKCKLLGPESNLSLDSATFQFLSPKVILLYVQVSEPLFLKLGCALESLEELAGWIVPTKKKKKKKREGWGLTQDTADCDLIWR